MSVRIQEDIMGQGSVVATRVFNLRFRVQSPIGILEHNASLQPAVVYHRMYTDHLDFESGLQVEKQTGQYSTVIDS